VTCSAPLATRTRTIEVANAQKAEVTLRADTDGASLSRLLMAANGTGLAGLAGLTVTAIRTGDTYLIGAPILGGLPGSPKVEVSAEALTRLFTRYRLRSPWALTGGQELTITLRNDSGAARLVTVTDDRSGLLRTLAAGKTDAPPSDADRAALYLVPQTTTRLVVATAEIPANADRHTVVVPIPPNVRGIIETFAVSAANDVRIAVASGKRSVVEAVYADTLERLFAPGFGLLTPIEIASGDDLSLIVSNDSGATRTVSFVAELIVQ
jgi:hypothetical protein